MYTGKINSRQCKGSEVRFTFGNCIPVKIKTRQNFFRSVCWHFHEIFTHENFPVKPYFTTAQQCLCPMRSWAIWEICLKNYRYLVAGNFRGSKVLAEMLADAPKEILAFFVHFIGYAVAECKPHLLTFKLAFLNFSTIRAVRQKPRKNVHHAKNFLLYMTLITDSYLLTM